MEPSSPTQNSRSPSPSSEQYLQIFVKNFNGETTSLTVPSSTSVATITSLLINHPSSSTFGSASQPASESVRLVHAGRPLSPDTRLEEHNIPPQALLSLTFPILGGAEESASAEQPVAQGGSVDAPAAPSSTQSTAPAPAPASATDPSAAAPTPASASATEATPAAASAPVAAPPTPAKKKRSNRCNFKACTSPAQRIVGDCGFCGGKFCGKHRLLESHACSGLEECREEEKRRNGERLGRERTVVVRGV